jgi:hypothetical protein
MWILLASVTTLAWGIACVFVIPLATQDLHPSVIEIVYGSVVCVANLVSLRVETALETGKFPNALESNHFSVICGADGVLFVLRCRYIDLPVCG